MDVADAGQHARPTKTIAPPRDGTLPVERGMLGMVVLGQEVQQPRFDFIQRCDGFLLRLAITQFIRTPERRAWEVP
jgi:hypothetical protein